MRRGRMIPIVAVVTATSMMVGTAGLAASRADAPTATGSLAPGDSGDRLEALLDGLDVAIDGLRDDPYLSGALDAAAAAPEASIDQARELVEDFSAEDLEKAESVLESAPALEQIPDAIDDAVDAANEFTPDTATTGAATGLRGAAGQALMAVPTIPTATYTDNCPSAGDPAALIIAALVLNQLQSAAYAAVIAAPSVIAVLGFSVPSGIKQVLAVVYGVALAVYLALAQTLAVASDCASAEGSAELKLAWPVAPAGSVTPPAGSTVAGSSQLSVDAALLAVGDVTAILNSVTQNLTLVEGQVTTLGERTASLNTTLSCTSGTPAGAPTATCSDGGSPGTGSDVVARVLDVQQILQTAQSDIDVLRNTQHLVLDKADDELVALDELTAQQIALAVEANLSNPAFHPVGLFVLPPPTGYLDVVAATATQAVEQFGGGESDLAAGRTALADGRYKDAYKAFHKAYQGALK